MLSHARSSRPRNNESYFAEPAKFLPVAFVVIIIWLLYGIYMCQHVLPLTRDPPTRFRGMTELVICNILTGLLWISYFQCILVHPGEVPGKEQDPSWQYAPQNPALRLADPAASSIEMKRSGDRRHCKWCAKYKPDRCHHCRVCNTCVLKMDHHCPWIYNCVGHRNHKYFLLLLLYSVLDLHFIFWTMLESVMAASSPDTPFFRMFSLLFGMTLSGFLGFLVNTFFIFHVWLILRAMTTIEFCEKGMESSRFDQGAWANLSSVLGNNIGLWFLPVYSIRGDGLHFEMDVKRSFGKDMEAGRKGGVPTLPHRSMKSPHGRMAGGKGSKGQRRPVPKAGTGSAPSSGYASEESGLDFEQALNVGMRAELVSSPSPTAVPVKYVGNTVTIHRIDEHHGRLRCQVVMADGSNYFVFAENLENNAHIPQLQRPEPSQARNSSGAPCTSSGALVVPGRSGDELI